MGLSLLFYHIWSNLPQTCFRLMVIANSTINICIELPNYLLKVSTDFIFTHIYGPKCPQTGLFLVNNWFHLNQCKCYLATLLYTFPDNVQISRIQVQIA